MRIAISVDGGQKHIMSYQTIGRSEQWKKNVLSNHAKSILEYYFEKPGWHTLKISPIDPGVVIDQIMVTFKPVQKVYAVPALTNKKS